MSLKVIFAADKHFLMGRSGGLPWPAKMYKEDMAWFKQTTNTVGSLGKKNFLITGFRTFESMRSVRPYNRCFVVVDRNGSDNPDLNQEGPIRITSLKGAIALSKQAQRLGMCDQIFVIGGARLFEQLVSVCPNEIEEIYATWIKKKFEGDVYLPLDILKHMALRQVRVVRDMHFCHYVRTEAPPPEQQYFQLIDKILTEGERCQDRTGVGTHALFGYQMRFDLAQYFPLLTSKKVFMRAVKEELLWFLTGKTDATSLTNKGIHIWDGNTTREALDAAGLPHLKVGDIGAGYGFQFRHFGAPYRGADQSYAGQGFDQVAYTLDQIKNNPHSRQIVISLWNPPFLKQAVLPPCHMVYQFRVYGKKLCCSMYQRSGDVGLGVPFNIASSALMTHIFARLCGLEVGTLVHTIGDAHIYRSHVEALKKQRLRPLLPFPKLEIRDRGQQRVEDFNTADFKVRGYISHPPVSMDMAV